MPTARRLLPSGRRRRAVVVPPRDAGAEVRDTAAGIKDGLSTDR
nr:hypothetical protein [Micrococcus yunnanensis]